MFCADCQEVIECRLCDRKGPHVHATEHKVAKLREFDRAPRALKLAGISNLDWGVPAVRYHGQWYKVPVDFLEKVWPRVKDRIMRSAPSPIPETEENHDQDSESD